MEHDAQQATYVELQVLPDGHEALWFDTANGDRYCFYLPVGYSFNANPEITPMYHGTSGYGM